jgi:NTE family protein
MAIKSVKTVSLVLGSGGARGLAHIGVIRWLEEHDFKIESVSGCSIGSLIGGAYAAGKLDDIEQWARAITKINLLSLLDLSWKSNGLVKGDKVINTMISIVGDVLIEDLPIKYTAVAADILNEKEVWMNSGKLFDGIRASISLPLFFTPFNYQGVELIDGGVLNPVPIAPTFGDNTDITIAVNLGGDVIYDQTDDVKEIAIKESDVQIKSSETADYMSPFTDKINAFVSNFTTTVSQNNWGAVDIANQAFDAMQSTIARQKLAAYPPDYSIDIARNACGTLAFEQSEKMIELGYKKAQQQLGHLL